MSILQKHVETTESTADEYSKQSEALQIKHAQQESLIDHLRHNVEKLSSELEDNRINLDSQTAINIQDKVTNVLTYRKLNVLCNL